MFFATRIFRWKQSEKEFFETTVHKSCCHNFLFFLNYYCSFLHYTLANTRAVYNLYTLIDLYESLESQKHRISKSFFFIND